ncbi:MAG: 2-C-methyl-D-erythritol 4-phosphate cytidylyltransferase [Bacilli bacterium]|nr:2-C-methyl-D-erythritol 4-phosphate cytidylyltransferase [Bacilli bacterium]
MNIALLLAAGKGTRLDSQTPKQFHLVDNKPVFSYSLETFHKVEEIDAIYVVTSIEGVRIIKNYVDEHRLSKVKDVILGGKTRQESVYLGLLAMRKEINDKDRILIHDAARALVSERVILDNIRACEKDVAAATIYKVMDTMSVSLDDEYYHELVDRTHLYHGQTPQTFTYELIRHAHEEALEDHFEGTDDVGLVLRLHEKVKLVPGERKNFKITTMEDLKLFESIVLGEKEKKKVFDSKKRNGFD